MNKRKKPNYKLRRDIAKAMLVVIILIPILIINKTKIFNFPLYISNIKYSGIIDSLFEANYKYSEAKNTLNYLKENKKISDDTKDYILKLNSKGYNKTTIDYLLRNLSDGELTEFLSKKYNKDYEEYIKLDLFDYSKFDRYLTYQKENKNLSIDDIVTRIELNLDKTYYEDSIEIKNPNDITILTNKYLEIPDDYEPKDLVDMSDDYANNMYGQLRLRKEAYEKFVEMCNASREDGVKFYAESAYRSYNHQNIIYKNYVHENGQEKADKYAAKPGFSEHELGLAIDLANIWTITTKGEEYAWLSKNAHKYGYIIRYKEEWEDITGYAAESWHIRYVGVETATKVRNKNIPYEEYYIKYIANKKKTNK
ncbi:MAG: M15 family metallopeptidase [Bacilli bacterium]|nr:M15 family metallopeptidase [Bacilli bacterium]